MPVFCQPSRCTAQTANRIVSSKYIRDLIRRDQAVNAEIETIRAALIEAEKSGEPQPFDDNLFKQEMRAKHG